MDVKHHVYLFTIAIIVIIIIIITGLFVPCTDPHYPAYLSLWWEEILNDSHLSDLVVCRCRCCSSNHDLAPPDFPFRQEWPTKQSSCHA